MSFFYATSVGDLVNRCAILVKYINGVKLTIQRFSKDIDHIDKTLPIALFLAWYGKFTLPSPASRETH